MFKLILFFLFFNFLFTNKFIGTFFTAVITFYFLTYKINIKKNFSDFAKKKFSFNKIKNFFLFFLIFILIFLFLVLFYQISLSASINIENNIIYLKTNHIFINKITENIPTVSALRYDSNLKLKNFFKFFYNFKYFNPWIYCSFSIETSILNKNLDFYAILNPFFYFLDIFLVDFCNLDYVNLQILFIEKNFFIKFHAVLFLLKFIFFRVVSFVYFRLYWTKNNPFIIKLENRIIKMANFLEPFIGYKPKTLLYLSLFMNVLTNFFIFFRYNKIKIIFTSSFLCVKMLFIYIFIYIFACQILDLFLARNFYNLKSNKEFLLFFSKKYYFRFFILILSFLVILTESFKFLKLFF